MKCEWVTIDVSTPRNPGMTCKIDKEDFDRVSQYKWGVAFMGQQGYKRPYVRTRIGGRKDSVYIRLHRLIMNADSDVEVDHINGDTLDNRKGNLRFATRLEQSRNTGMRKNNTTGYKGVSYIARLKKYRAYIVVNRKQTNLGLHETAEAASEAYDAAARQLFGEFHRKQQTEEK